MEIRIKYKVSIRYGWNFVLRDRRKCHEGATEPEERFTELTYRRPVSSKEEAGHTRQSLSNITHVLSRPDLGRQNQKIRTYKSVAPRGQRKLNKISG